MPAHEKNDYLAVYDYGMGGIWLKIAERSRGEIAERYPQLTVFTENDRPDWMTEAQEHEYVGDMRFDIDSHAGSWLERLDEQDGG